MRHPVFSRAQIVAYVLRVYGTDLTPDETVAIEQVVRLKGVTPAMWIVDYTRRYQSWPITIRPLS